MGVQQFRGTAAYGAFSGRGQDIHTIRIPFIGYPNYRPGIDKTKDPRYLNCYFDPVKSPITGEMKYYLTKRPGLTQHNNPVHAIAATALVAATQYYITSIGTTDFTLIGATSNTIGLLFTATGAGTGTGTAIPSTPGRGMISWLGDIYSVFGTKLYKNAVDLGVTLTTSTGRCGMAFTRPGATNQSVCVNDGVHLYLIAKTTGTVTRVPGLAAQLTISSISVANPSVITTSTNHGLTTGDIIFISGVVGTTPTIQGAYTITVTGLTTFTIPVNVSVGASAGTISGFPSTNTTDLQYKDGYMFVLKPDSTLWNCAVDDPTSWDPTMFITAQMHDSSGVGLAVQTNFMFVFGTTATQAFYDNANSQGSPMNNYEAAMQKLGCRSQASIVSDEGQVTWVSNTATGAQSVYLFNGITGIKEIGYPALNRLIRAEISNFSAINARMMRMGGKRFYVLSLPTTNKRTFVYDYDTELWVEWSNAAGTDIYPFIDSCQSGGQLYIQTPNEGWVYEVDQTNYQDVTTNFQVLARFNRIDLDINNRKFVNRAEIIGDQQTSTCNVNLSYSDDDYITWSTARILDLSRVRNFCKNLGNFRRRTWQLDYTGNTPLRIESLELKIRLGDD